MPTLNCLIYKCVLCILMLYLTLPKKKKTATSSVVLFWIPLVWISCACVILLQDFLCYWLYNNSSGYLSCVYIQLWLVEMAKWSNYYVLMDLETINYIDVLPRPQAGHKFAPCNWLGLICNKIWIYVLITWLNFVKVQPCYVDCEYGPNRQL